MSQQTSSSAQTATRRALTRVLAVDSRNALARVELAASELSRFELNPSADDRIITIHDAVSEIDSLLAKIDLLASPRSVASWPPIAIDGIWQRIRKRLDATLAARGISFVERDGHTQKTAARVEIPEAALEAILCAFLRVVVAEHQGERVFEFEATSRDEDIHVTLVVTPAETECAPALEDGRLRPRSSVELDVQLAEWGGSLDAVPASDHAQGYFGMTFPRGSLDV